MTITNIKISPSDWKKTNDSYEISKQFPYEADIYIDDITEKHYLGVSFQKKDRFKFAPIAFSEDGKVVIFSKKKISKDIIISSIQYSLDENDIKIEEFPKIKMTCSKCNKEICSTTANENKWTNVGSTVLGNDVIMHCAPSNRDNHNIFNTFYTMYRNVESKDGIIMDRRYINRKDTGEHYCKECYKKLYTF